MTKLEKIQEILGVKVDDSYGPITERAFEQEIAASRLRNAKDNGDDTIAGVDARSARNILTLHPKAREAMTKLVIQGRKAGLRVKITSAYRTYEEQAKLHRAYKAGGPKAAPAGYSNHNFGIAADVTLFEKDERTPIWESPGYTALGLIGERLGLNWGGRWKGKGKDEPHFCFRPKWAKDLSESAMIAALRSRKASGKDYFAA